VGQLYQHFKREIVPGSPFDRFLKRAKEQQSAHKRTQTDEQHLTLREIKNDFPDLVRELFPNGLKAGEHNLKRLASSSSFFSLDSFY
jgi:hypothetical protein